jgi:hypothetical protein
MRRTFMQRIINSPPFTRPHSRNLSGRDFPSFCGRPGKKARTSHPAEKAVELYGTDILRIDLEKRFQ